jgi:hypothetical protein
VFYELFIRQCIRNHSNTVHELCLYQNTHWSYFKKDLNLKSGNLFSQGILCSGNNLPQHITEAPSIDTFKNIYATSSHINIGAILKSLASQLFQLTTPKYTQEPPTFGAVQLQRWKACVRRASKHSTIYRGAYWSRRCVSQDPALNLWPYHKCIHRPLDSVSAAENRTSQRRSGRVRVRCCRVRADHRK